MYQFHYTDGIGCKVSLVRIPWYHAYSGIGTLIKKYDFFSIQEQVEKNFRKNRGHLEIISPVYSVLRCHAIRSDVEPQRSKFLFFLSLFREYLSHLSIDAQRSKVCLGLA